MVVVYLSDDPVHNRVLEAFYEGCSAEKKLVRNFEYEPSDIAVIFGVYKSKVPKSHPRGEVFRRQREKNLDVIVLETGYVNRGDGENHHYAAGFNGLNGRANFKNKGMTDERWRALNTPLRPYSPGTHIILCGQVPWDASVEGSQHVRWLKSTASNLRKITGRPIVFRPHPKAQVPHIPGCEFPRASLEDDLMRAHAVVCFNSNSSVEAAIHGKPVFVFDEGAMTWEIANRGLLDIDTPVFPKREQWAWNLANAQWTPQEMRDGYTWRHLTRDTAG